jgi:hypothetical protein
VQDQLDHKVRKVQRVLQDLQDQQGLLVQQDHKVQPVHQDQVEELRDLQDQQGLLVQQDHKVQRVLRELPVRQEVQE